MKRNYLVLLLLSLFLSACSGNAPSQTTDPIEIKDAWARPAMMMDMENNSSGNMNMGDRSSSNGAAYLTIVNRGATADRLTSAESDVAGSVELHQTIVKENVMSMSPVEAIDVPANGRVELKPGGYHIMLVGLKQDLKAGSTIQLTLVFEKAGRTNLNVEVKNP